MDVVQYIEMMTSPQARWISRNKKSAFKEEELVRELNWQLCVLYAESTVGKTAYDVLVRGAHKNERPLKRFKRINRGLKGAEHLYEKPLREIEMELVDYRMIENIETSMAKSLYMKNS